MKSEAILKQAIKRSSRDRVIKQLLNYANKNPKTKTRVYKLARRLYFGSGPSDAPPPPPPVSQRSKRERIVIMTDAEREIYNELRNLLQTKVKAGVISLTSLFGPSGNKITLQTFLQNLRALPGQKWRDLASKIQILPEDSRLKILSPLFGFKIEGRNLVAYHRDFHSTATKIQNAPKPDPEEEAQKLESKRIADQARKEQREAEKRELARQAAARAARVKEEERRRLDEQRKSAALTSAADAESRRRAQALREAEDQERDRELARQMRSMADAARARQAEQAEVIRQGGEKIYTLEQRDKALQAKMAEALGAVGKLVTTISDTGGTEADSQALAAVKAELQEIENQDGMAKEEVTQKLSNIQQKVIDMVSRFKDKLREKNSENSDLEARIRTTTSALERATTENERIARELADTQTKIARQFEIISGLEADKERLQREIAEMTGTNTKHTQDLARIRGQRRELRDELTQARADLDAASAKAEEQIGTLTGERDSARRDLAEKEQKISDLEGEIASQKTNIAQLISIF